MYYIWYNTRVFLVFITDNQDIRFRGHRWAQMFEWSRCTSAETEMREDCLSSDSRRGTPPPPADGVNSCRSSSGSPPVRGGGCFSSSQHASTSPQARRSHVWCAGIPWWAVCPPKKKTTIEVWIWVYVPHRACNILESLLVFVTQLKQDSTFGGLVEVQPPVFQLSLTDVGCLLHRQEWLLL